MDTIKFQKSKVRLPPNKRQKLEHQNTAGSVHKAPVAANLAVSVTKATGHGFKEEDVATPSVSSVDLTSRPSAELLVHQGLRTLLLCLVRCNHRFITLVDPRHWESNWMRVAELTHKRGVQLPPEVSLPKPPLVFQKDNHGRLVVEKGGVVIRSSEECKKIPGWFSAAPAFKAGHQEWRIQLLHAVNDMQLGIKTNCSVLAHTKSQSGETLVKEGRTFTWHPGSGDLLVDNNVFSQCYKAMGVLHKDTILGIQITPRKGGMSMLVEANGKKLGPGLQLPPVDQEWFPVFCLHDAPHRVGVQGLALL
jgi:hypothetical protein|uniref:Uncharacterized protein n=1 Tax=Eutreptiella gymnastica TaxID=73025 RepID=A0A7S4CE86_9EUGL